MVVKWCLEFWKSQHQDAGQAAALKQALKSKKERSAARRHPDGHRQAGLHRVEVGHLVELVSFARHAPPAAITPARAGTAVASAAARKGCMKRKFTQAALP